MRITLSVFAVIFLFMIHSKLQWYLNPDKQLTEKVIVWDQFGKEHREYHAKNFSFFRWNDENNSSSMIAAIIFAISTVCILNLFNPKTDWFFWVSCILFVVIDGMGTILYLFPEVDKLRIFTFIMADGKLNDIPNTKILGAFYYGIYIAIILFSIGLLRKKDSNDRNIPTKEELDKWGEEIFKPKNGSNHTIQTFGRGMGKTNTRELIREFERKEEARNPIKEVVKINPLVDKKKEFYEPMTIMDMYNEGKTQAEIADLLKISQSKVSKTLKKLTKQI
jgi:hypothetical protein